MNDYLFIFGNTWYSLSIAGSFSIGLMQITRTPIRLPVPIQ